MKMECVYHKDETVILVCTHCDKYPFVCAICVEEDHAEHKLQSLRSAAQSIRQDLEQTQLDNLQVIENINSDLDDLAKIKKDLEQGRNLTENEIVTHVNIIKNEVDAMKGDVLQKFKTELGLNADVINKTQEALKQQMSQIDTFQTKLAQVQKINNNIDVIKAVRDVEVPDTSRVPRPDIPALQFTPGIVSDEGLGLIFGGITDVNKSTEDTSFSSEDEETEASIMLPDDGSRSIKREADTKVTTVTAFKLSKDDGIDTMFCHTSGKCFLKCQDKNSVKLLNMSGQIIDAINLGTQTKGFTVTSDNRLLFCCTAQECVKEMELPNGEITEKFSTSPLTPNCICTGPSGEIYVTLFDENDYNLEKDSTRVLIQYTSWGGEMARRQTDVFGEHLFVVPMDVFVNNTGTRVAVINKINDNRRELVVLDQDLSPLFVYTGPSVLTGRSLSGFKINGATFDTRDNILVAEEKSQTIQLLSPSCEPLKVLMTMEASPWTLSLHGNEVWVGFDEGIGQVFRYSY